MFTHLPLIKRKKSATKNDFHTKLAACSAVCSVTSGPKVRLNFFFVKSFGQWLPLLGLFASFSNKMTDSALQRWQTARIHSLRSVRANYCGRRLRTNSEKNFRFHYEHFRGLLTSNRYLSSPQFPRLRAGLRRPSTSIKVQHGNRSLLCTVSETASQIPKIHSNKLKLTNLERQVAWIAWIWPKSHWLPAIQQSRFKEVVTLSECHSHILPDRTPNRFRTIKKSLRRVFTVCLRFARFSRVFLSQNFSLFTICLMTC